MVRLLAFIGVGTGTNEVCPLQDDVWEWEKKREMLKERVKSWWCLMHGGRAICTIKWPMGCHMSPCVAVSFLQIIGTLLVFTSTKNNVPHAGMEVKSVIEQSMARRSMDDHNSNDGCWLFKNLLFKFFSGFCFECVQTCFVT